MPKYTIDVTPRQNLILKALVTRQNETVGKTLTVKEWLDVHVKELCIIDDLNTALIQLHEKQEKDTKTAYERKATKLRDDLISALDQSP